MPSPLAAEFALDPSITFLNHGSFGACPRVVLERQAELRAQLEAEPVRFFVREAQAGIDAARERTAALLGASPEDLVFVRNATFGVNSVLASLPLAPGDELLTIDHAYGACRNALSFFAERAGARVVVAKVPFPIESPDEVVDAVLAAVGPRTRLAMLDHVTSPSGLVLPLERLVPALRARGVETLVDGAHAPGMLPLDLDRLGAAYYTGNLHKWLCAPKGSAILHVRRDLADVVRPVVIGHGATSRRPRPRLWEEFDWLGTDDPTPWLCVPAAIDALERMHPGGLDGMRAAQKALALHVRRRLSETLGVPPAAPASMIAALVATPLPVRDATPAESSWSIDPVCDALFREHRIEVPVYAFPAPPARTLRVACQVYVGHDDVERLCESLVALGQAPARR